MSPRTNTDVLTNHTNRQTRSHTNVHMPAHKRTRTSACTHVHTHRIHDKQKQDVDGGKQVVQRDTCFHSKLQLSPPASPPPPPLLCPRRYRPSSGACKARAATGTVRARCLFCAPCCKVSVLCDLLQGVCVVHIVVRCVLCTWLLGVCVVHLLARCLCCAPCYMVFV